jgi:O-succinylbenzoate synthase
MFLSGYNIVGVFFSIELELMRIDRVRLWIVRLPLVRGFTTSSSSKDRIDHIVLAIDAEGAIGWGECASPADPYYCPETTQTCRHILEDFLIPATIGREWTSIDEFTRLYRNVKGNRFAKAGLEIACWDAFGKARGKSVAELLGGTRREIESGVSLGIESEPAILFDQIDRFVSLGYKRVKLKIKPGWDVEIVRAVRERYQELPLQVDANSAYTLDDRERLKRLDDFNLLLIEQPLADDDIIDHAQLQAMMRTPICLDESVHTSADARKALDLGSCRVINVKTSRVGGLLEAARIHDHCLAREAPVWCGGMHEFGIGRAANLAIASLPGFTLPGDISGSDRYYREDLIDPPIRADRGVVEVPTGPGLGVEPVLDRIERGSLYYREFTTC